MANNKISVGIIGFGGRGTSMAKAISAFSDKIYVSAVAEPLEIRRKMAVEEYGIPAENVYCDYNIIFRMS